VSNYVNSPFMAPAVRQQAGAGSNTALRIT
jgi:hypothetical protein